MKGEGGKLLCQPLHEVVLLPPEKIQIDIMLSDHLVSRFAADTQFSDRFPGSARNFVSGVSFH